MSILAVEKIFVTHYNDYSTRDLEFKQMEERGEIIAQQVSGCFTATTDSQYGLGLGVCDLAELDVQYARSREKLVSAKVGRRVVLRRHVTIVIVT